ncbi:MerR family transcriptional regulator [Bartonella tribocorum]|uniref:Regulatory protein MerR n=1 Tax=Bartonella tribocorum (strain DSM 28219 / CCUG 45778 / CIP 105476 / IBS 506) TaxID=382640 RepID=A9IVB1_BART1|nr:MerR family transcriptional regulator [Bartonella tribocorum]CAK01671.1 regulatory protein MerR [Bartonella tribocorum CIP 105476]CDO48917.1 putative transcriptional regulator, MerR family [Bartonella tribocorum]
MDKSSDAFRTISEVAELLELPQHVLRFWETRFRQIKPMKRGGGRRYYRPVDVDLLNGIKQLLYDQGYTIKGVQRLLKENGVAFVTAFGNGDLDAMNVVIEKKHAGQTFENTNNKPKKSSFGLLSFMRNEGETSVGSVNLYKDKTDKALLQETLFELIECKRVLDRAR